MTSTRSAFHFLTEAGCFLVCRVVPVLCSRFKVFSLPASFNSSLPLRWSVSRASCCRSRWPSTFASFNRSSYAWCQNDGVPGSIRCSIRRVRSRLCGPRKRLLSRLMLIEMERNNSAVLYWPKAMMTRNLSDDKGDSGRDFMIIILSVIAYNIFFLHQDVDSVLDGDRCEPLQRVSS